MLTSSYKFNSYVGFTNHYIDFISIVTGSVLGDLIIDPETLEIQGKRQDFKETILSC